MDEMKIVITCINDSNDTLSEEDNNALVEALTPVFESHGFSSGQVNVIINQ